MKYGLKAGWRTRAVSETVEDGRASATDVAACDLDGQESAAEGASPVEDALTDGADTPCEEAQTEASPWEAEAAEVGQTYPQFDWAVERQDPRFTSMLQAGVPMLDAYRALHMEEVLAEWSEKVRTEAEKRITDHVQARGSRPSENGAAGTQGVQLWQNVHRLTRQKRAEIANRAHNGEQISFR